MLLEAQVTAWRAVAVARGRDVRLVAGTPSLTLAVDHRLLRQALANLIANALDHGTGDVLLAARRRGGRVRIEVLDGPRRRPAAAPVAVPRSSLLGAIRRAGRHRRGHGLRVAADVAARHGGRLLLARDGRGAVAVIELPLPGTARLASRRRRPRRASRPSGVRGARVPA
jgi:signal transduction histidine kinase